MTPPQLSTATLKRLPRIKKGLLLGDTIKQIAEHCGVYEKTIDRDLRVWRTSGLFEDWIKEEWLRLHTIIIHEHPVEAYKQLTRLLSQTLTRKTEVTATMHKKVEYKIDITTLLREYESNIIEAVDRTIQADRARKQVDTA